ncbi:hypothetical protein [Gilvimarinus algae]|uniref:Uncharacterized protein n=1 Tax=Gilvimarinus algae TaxID=3058037 RepID=A0ABT8T9E8_9GAMM|nr:hypothetical protein [Gilvimarinus sp. SDUM040014]MDO3380759.1 hypothetical protein [Gilvimarinus sp. SDUM040014]
MYRFLAHIYKQAAGFEAAALRLVDDAEGAVCAPVAKVEKLQVNQPDSGRDYVAASADPIGSQCVSSSVSTDNGRANIQKSLQNNEHQKTASFRLATVWAFRLDLPFYY